MGNCCSTEGAPKMEENSASSPKASHSKQKVVGRRGSAGHQHQHQHHHPNQQQHQQQHQPHHHQQEQDQGQASPVSTAGPGGAMVVTIPLSLVQQQQQQQQSQPPSAMMSMLSNKERDAIIADPSISLPTKLILNPPFSCFSRFTEHLYLTGIGGITLENLKQHNIKLVVNVAQEVPNYSPPPPGVLYYKYPLLDNYQTSISESLHSAADLMYKVVKGGGNVVVYCTAGMSRSSAVVLAYAIKHLRAPLKQAFAKLQETRTYARPNLAFFTQLAAFEATFLGAANSTTMVAETLDTEADSADDADGGSSMDDGQAAAAAAAKAKAKGKPRKVPKPGEPSITVPDFYKKDYPHLFKMEVEEALAGNCPMANNIGVATVTAYSTAAAMSSAASSATSAVSSLSAVSKPPGGKQQKSSVGRGGGGGKSAIVVATTSTSNSSAYQTYELKPFVLEPISYPAVLAEIAKTRKKMKPTTGTATAAAMSVNRNPSPLSLKKVAKK